MGEARTEAIWFIGDRYDTMTDEEKDFSVSFWTRIVVQRNANREVTK